MKTKQELIKFIESLPEILFIKDFSMAQSEPCGGYSLFDGNTINHTIKVYERETTVDFSLVFKETI